MAKGDDGTHDEKHVFDSPATLREPAAPSVPRVMPPSAVSVIPLPTEEQARAASEALLSTLQEAREATDALLRDILEEEPPAGSPGPDAPRAAPSKEEDWPAELHALPLEEE